MQILLSVMMICAVVFFHSCGEQKPQAPNAHVISRMYESYKVEDFQYVDDCSVEEALVLIAEKDAILLDVRSARERSVSMIHGAIEKETFLGLGKTGRPVLLYCTIGYRSGQACWSLKKSGYQAINIRGGILSWIDRGQKLEHMGQECKKVHVYGSKWNYVPDDYEAIW